MEHPVFIFIAAATKRLNKSVAWIAKCKKCGHKQLVGSSQIKRGTHASCVKCQLKAELDKREL